MATLQVATLSSETSVSKLEKGVAEPITSSIPRDIILVRPCRHIELVVVVDEEPITDPFRRYHGMDLPILPTRSTGPKSESGLQLFSLALVALSL